jgi:hypothetical protein
MDDINAEEKRLEEAIQTSTEKWIREHNFKMP